MISFCPSVRHSLLYFTKCKTSERADVVVRQAFSQENLGELIVFQQQHVTQKQQTGWQGGCLFFVMTEELEEEKSDTSVVI